MNQHLRQRIEALLNRDDTATLATCGQAGPQISIINYDVKQLDLHLFLPSGTDHLFNLETNPRMVLLTDGWKLYGIGTVNHHNVKSRHGWQVVVVVKPTQLHILHQQNSIETIDF